MSEDIWLRYADTALVPDVARRTTCRQPGCRAPIWWGYTFAGKVCPFDIKPDRTFTTDLPLAHMCRQTVETAEDEGGVSAYSLLSFVVVVVLILIVLRVFGLW